MLGYRSLPCIRLMSRSCLRCCCAPQQRQPTTTILKEMTTTTSSKGIHAKNNLSLGPPVQLQLQGTIIERRTPILWNSVTTVTATRSPPTPAIIQQQKCYKTTHAPDTVNPPNKVKRYLVDNCVRFAEWYERFLERRYPKVFQVYKIFKIGIRDFITDTKMYYNVTTELWTGKSLNDFTRKELEVYRQYPKDVWKVSPVLIISALPFANYVVFPIAYMYPKWFLSPQFWTQEQKDVIWGEQLAKRLGHCRIVLRNLRARHTHMDDDHPLQQNLKNALNKIRHFQNLSISEILDLKPLFEDYPCHLEKISIAYVRQLAKSNGLPLRRSTLTDATLVAHYTHLALEREGIESLSDDELAKACYARSLNPVGVSRKEQIHHLSQWLEVTKAIDENSLSLLLHLPLFLAYNHPKNRQLTGRSLQWRQQRNSKT